MGLKWFRARLTMNPKSKNLTRRPEFYRSMSQFDSDVQFPAQQSSGENRVAAGARSVPASPASLANNPTSTLIHRQSESSAMHEANNFKASSRREWQGSSDEETGSPDDDKVFPRHLPRESIELMRGGSAEGSPRQLGTKSRKADFKKKKARAPIPNAVNNSSENVRGSATIERGRNSDGSEIEI